VIETPKRRRPGQTLLGPVERNLRARLAIAGRNGVDRRPLRLRYDEAKAQRELADAAKRLRAARVAQGLPATITDEATLDSIALLIDGAMPTRKTKAASAFITPAAEREVASRSGALPRIRF